MGAAFMEAVHGVERPAVGLLNIGEEPTKGGETLVAAHERLSAGPLNFVGNVEGNALVAGAADVVVTDGFTGNVALKTMEGSAKAVRLAQRAVDEDMIGRTHRALEDAGVLRSASTASVGNAHE